MSTAQVIRAWRDPEYRATLSSEQLAALPSHPAGLIELSDDTLASAAGLNTVAITVLPPCSQWTFHNIVRCCPL
jgi:mersacidin/lichenicidin family type 2 lantibiotic